MPSARATQNHVFLSYRHEGPVHAAAVHRLGKLLREASIPVLLDHFYLDDNPGGPDVGWPNWSTQAAEECRCVLVIASPGWFQAFEGQGDPESGRGAAAEAHVLKQYLYDEKYINAKIRIVCLDDTAHNVPARLKGFHMFRPFTNPNDFTQLVKWLAKSLGLENIECPDLTWPEPAPFESRIADRNQHEWPAIVSMLAGRSRERILLLEGPSGVGKSELLRQARAYAQDRSIAVAYVDFKAGMQGVQDVLGHIDLEVGNELPNFTAARAGQTHLLRKDLRKLSQPLLLIFDTFEHAEGNRDLTEWLRLQILPEVETSPRLAIIVAGQRVPGHANENSRQPSRRFTLEPITDFDAWREWKSRHHPRVADENVRLLMHATKGAPNLMASLCANLAERA